MGRILFLLAILGALVLGGAAEAQEAPAAPEAPAAGETPRIDALKAALEGRSDGGLMPDVLPADVLGEAGTAALRESLTAYYNYRVDGFRHRQNVFTWQLVSSVIIFVMVTFLVLVGVYFSWLQFRKSLEPGAGEARDTTFEASTAGLKVSSPVLGVIILAISLAFFYLYLVHIYPISEIF